MRSSPRCLADRVALGLHIPTNYNWNDGRTRRAIALAHRIHTGGYVPEVDARAQLAKHAAASGKGSCFIDHFVRAAMRGFFCVIAEDPADFVEQRTSTETATSPLLLASTCTPSPSEVMLRAHRRTVHGRPELANLNLRIRRTQCSVAKATFWLQKQATDVLVAHGMRDLEIHVAAPSNAGDPGMQCLGVVEEEVQLSLLSKRNQLAAEDGDGDGDGDGAASINRAAGVLHQLLNAGNVAQPRTGASPQNSAAIADAERPVGSVEVRAISPCPLQLAPAIPSVRHFRVLLRRIEASDSNAAVVNEAVKALRRDGFLNYFPRSHFHDFTRRGAHPGLHLLKGEFRAAASALIHTPKSATLGSRANSAAAERIDAELQRPRHGSGIVRAQRMLRDALSHCDDNDPELGEAICLDTFREGLGVRFCASLVNEFTSLVWNELLSARVRLFGSLSVAPGDLFLPPAQVETSPRRKPLVRVATKDDVSCGRVAITDVLLPVPGAAVRLPENKLRDVFHSLLEKYNLPMNPETGRCEAFTNRGVRANPLGMHFGGLYRRIVVHPIDLKSSLRRDTSTTFVDEANGSRHEANTLTLSLDFSLPHDAHPTMMLRELCKVETNLGAVSSVGQAVRTPDATEGHRSLEELRERQQRNLLRRKRRNAISSSRSLNYALVQQKIFKNRGPTHRSLLPAINCAKSVV